MWEFESNEWSVWWVENEKYMQAGKRARKKKEKKMLDKKKNIKFKKKKKKPKADSHFSYDHDSVIDNFPKKSRILQLGIFESESSG